jgi:hypothetical protein
VVQFVEFCHIVDNYCLIIDRGIFHVALVCHIFDNYCLRYDGGVVHVVVCDIVDNNCMMFVTAVVRVAYFSHNRQLLLEFDKAVVHVDESYPLKFDIEMVCAIVVGYIIDHYCLIFDCRLSCVVLNCCVVILSHLMDNFKLHVGGHPSTRRKSTMLRKLITESIT